MLVVASRRIWSGVSLSIRFHFVYLTCFTAENVLSYMHELPNVERIFSAKSFGLGNLSLLTNFSRSLQFCLTLLILLSTDVILILLELAYCNIHTINTDKAGRL